MKEVIFKKSLELFTNKGFKSVTMDDIANDLGISKKTIYQHFSSKNELIKQAIDYVFDASLDKLKSISGKCKTPIHEHFAMKNYIADLFGFNIQASTIYQFNKYYPHLAEKVQKKRHDNYDLIILNNLKEGVKLGYYREDIDLDFVGKLFFSTTTALCNDEIYMNSQDNKSLSDLNFKFLDYHLHAIVTPKGLQILEQLLNNHK